jgi:hypothetical protein
MWEGRRKDHVLAVERRYGKWCGVQSETFTINHGVDWQHGSFFFWEVNLFCIASSVNYIMYVDNSRQSQMNSFSTSQGFNATCFG